MYTLLKKKRRFVSVLSASTLKKPLYRSFLLLMAVLSAFLVSGTLNASTLPAYASNASSKPFKFHRGLLKTATAATNSAVTTSKANNARNGLYPNETNLTTTNVSSGQFGKAATFPVDGYVYAQPLYIPNITLADTTTHNLVFVATEHDSVYAFDPDNTSTAAPLWHTSFINPAAGITPFPSTDAYPNIADPDIKPEIGITGTPVIDQNTGTLYVVALTKENGNFIQRLHALDVKTGHDKAGSPVTITASVPGTGDGSSAGVLPFSPLRSLQRPGLLLFNNILYIGWSSFNDTSPYHGWVISYNPTSLQQIKALNIAPNGSGGGIWQAGTGLAADAASNSLYFETGNGTLSLDTGGSDGGDSVLRVSADLQIKDFFAPFNDPCIDPTNLEIGSSGTMLIPSQSGTTHPNLMLAGGKEGRIYLLDRDNLGKYTPIPDVCAHQDRTDVDKIVQEFPPSTLNGGIFSTPAYWNGSDGKQYIYEVGTSDHLKAFQLNNGLLSTAPTSQTPESFNYPGGNPVVSSNGTTAGTGIVWSITPPASCTATDHCNPSGISTLRAYDATNLNNELYSSSQNANDALPNYVKFSVPTIANGEVFVGTRNSLVVYGLFTSYNNIGISDNSDPSAADYDNVLHGYSSYSAQALQGAGLTPGNTFAFNGTNFTWPNVIAGDPDNYQAIGQTIPVTPVANATTLAFLGSSTNGSVSGQAIINYSDNSTQNFTLGLTDWAVGTPAFGNKIAAQMSYRNSEGGQNNTAVKIFYADVSLQPGKTVQSVTLPAPPGPGQLHIFSIGTSSNNITGVAYNNIGISDNGNMGPGNFDNGGFSYSAQALQAVGLTPGNSSTYNGVSFVWPNLAAGIADNYQANGQTLPVTPVNNATRLGFLGASTNGPSQGTATIAYTNGTSQTFTLGFTDWAVGTPALNNQIIASMPYRNGAGGRQNIPVYIFYAEVALPAGKTVQSITLPSTVNQGSLHVFAIGTGTNPSSASYNNIGITDDANRGPGNFDGGGFSYSAQTLQAQGITAGATVTYNGVSFIWPNVASGVADNYQANGQTIAVTPVSGATTLAFLGSAASGSTTGTATVTYTDATTQTFPLGLTDWAVNTPSFGNKIVASMAYRNGGGGQQNITVNLFYADVTLATGKTVQSVSLPTAAAQGQLHIFAIGTSVSTIAAAPYNNIGITDDANRNAGNFDGNAFSYSAQALQAAGLTAGHPFIYNGVTFTWPNVASGVADNYQVNGQTVAVTPVSGATTLAFLGSASGGPSTGTITITYTDGSTQTAALGMSDWTLNGGATSASYGNTIAASTTYRNVPSSSEPTATYLFYAAISLQAGKTVSSVTLPSTVNQGQLHIFAVATK